MEAEADHGPPMPLPSWAELVGLLSRSKLHVRPQHNCFPRGRGSDNNRTFIRSLAPRKTDDVPTDSLAWQPPHLDHRPHVWALSGGAECHLLSTERLLARHGTDVRVRHGTQAGRQFTIPHDGPRGARRAE